MQSLVGGRAIATRIDAGHVNTDPVSGRRHRGAHGYAGDPLIESLSRREQEILQLLNQGLSNKAISGNAFISVNTVKYHLKNLYAKLGVGSRFAAICRARRLGLV